MFFKKRCLTYVRLHKQTKKEIYLDLALGFPETLISTLLSALFNATDANIFSNTLRKLSSLVFLVNGAIMRKQTVANPMIDNPIDMISIISIVYTYIEVNFI
jgi:hypothetical protein